MDDIEYVVEWDLSAEALTKRINLRLGSGWKFHGSLVCSQHRLYQAMIKTKGDEADEPNPR